MQYEIHVTVKTDDIPKFRIDCNEIGVKPILIETEKSGEFNNQVMTSSKYSDDDYHETIFKTINALGNKGYEILRVKVEILPLITKHSNFIYYESHLRLKLEKGFDRSLLLGICEINDFHLSKNLFKSCEGYDYQMMTYRNYDIGYEEFARVIDSMKELLIQHKIEFDKVEIEECIFDSNISVDKNWI